MKDRNAALLEVGKTVVAAVIATVSTTWAARGILAEHDRRLSVTEARQQASDANVSAALSEIRSDVREVRAVLTATARK